MDLTAAVPAAERGKRLPTVDEISDALVLARDQTFGGTSWARRWASAARRSRRCRSASSASGAAASSTRTCGPATRRPRRRRRWPTRSRSATRVCSRYLALPDGRTADERHPLGHRPPLRHLRLGEPQLRDPRGHGGDQGRARPLTARRREEQKARPRRRSRARSKRGSPLLLRGDDVVDVERVLARGEGPAVERRVRVDVDPDLLNHRGHEGAGLAGGGGRGVEVEAQLRVGSGRERLPHRVRIDVHLSRLGVDEPAAEEARGRAGRNHVDRGVKDPPVKSLGGENPSRTSTYWLKLVKFAVTFIAPVAGVPCPTPSICPIVG